MITIGKRAYGRDRFRWFLSPNVTAERKRILSFLSLVRQELVYMLA